jgi:1-acyl-sn-glycerol-3-phosphate acyltransferase
MSQENKESKLHDLKPDERLESTLNFHIFGPIVHLIVRFVVRCCAPNLKVTGRKNIPLRGAVLICPNHTSDGDPPLISSSIFRPMWWMGKRELFSIPVVSPLISFWQTFPVDPGSPDRAALKRCEELLKRGNGLVIFPEGRVSPTGEIGPILPGAVMIALRTGAPVIPAGVVGIDQIMPYKSVVPKPSLKPVRVHFGEAIDFKDLKGLPAREQREKAAQRLTEAIRAAIEVARRSA